jgi:hypothetical protein
VTRSVDSPLKSAAASFPRGRPGRLPSRRQLNDRENAIFLRTFFQSGRISSRIAGGSARACAEVWWRLGALTGITTVIAFRIIEMMHVGRGTSMEVEK